MTHISKTMHNEVERMQEQLARLDKERERLEKKIKVLDAAAYELHMLDATDADQ